MKLKNPLFATFPHLVRSHWPRSKIVMETVKTVLSGAIGIRSCRGALGAANLSPMYIVIGAIIFVVLFTITLLTIAHIATS
jgi:hypothetical protein